MKSSLVVVAISLVPAVSLAQPWNGIISSARATDWSQAGVAGYSQNGTLPSASWTQCGSTISPYGSSASYASPAAIINAISACSGQNKYVLLGAGDFYLSSSIHNSGVSGVELRGAGPQQTKLHFNGTATCAGGRGSCLVDFESADSTYASGSTSFVSWTAGYSQGATTVTVSDGSKLSAGTMLVFDQCDTGYSGSPCTGSSVDNGSYFNCEQSFASPSGPGCSENGPENSSRPNRGQEEMAQVVSCSPACGTAGSTTVTISHPLIHANWSSSQTPQAWYIQPSQYVGMQGFSLDGTGFSYSSLNFAAAFNNLSNFWIRNVQIANTPNTAIFAWQSMNGDLANNYLYALGQANPSNDSSGINYLLFDSVLANNIIHKGKVGLIPSGAGAGNVIAYNFAVNAGTGDGYMFGDVWAGHSNGSDYNLYEGNVCNQLLFDQTHGTQLMITAYRNFFTGFESCANGNCGSSTVKTNEVNAVLDTSWNRYENLIANVLGTPTVSTLGYQYSNASFVFFNGSGLGYPYNIGSGNQGISNPIPIDPVVATTLFRWGNWDAFNGSTQWTPSEVPSGIGLYPNSVPTSCTSTNASSCPASFYYSARPAWYPTTTPFPAIGPDVTGGNVGRCAGAIGTTGQQAGTAAISSSQCAGATLTPSWDGHIHAIPAMTCYLSTMGGLPDGTGPELTFDATICYTEVGGNDAGADASSPSDASPDGGVPNPGSQGGCGCRLEESGSTGWSASLALGLVTVAGVSRRRQRLRRG